MPRLTEQSLSSLHPDVSVPSYDRAGLTTGVVHLGVGGFHRAHEAMYLDRLLEAGGDPSWSVCGVGTLPADRAMQEALEPQGCLYTLVLKGTDGSVRPRVIGSIARYLHAPADPETVVATLADRSNPHRLAHDHRGRLPHQRRDRGVRGHPRRGRRPRARSCSRHGVRTRRRGSRPATAVRRRRLHRAVLRQRLRQRRGGPSQLHRVRRAQGPRARPVDGRARVLPQLDGRPDHAGHLRPGPPRPGRPVRDRRRVAGGRRAVRPVGAAGPLRRRPPRTAGRRGAARGRRGAVRADEAAAAQRQPPGARVPRAPRGLRLRARGVRGTRRSCRCCSGT